MEDLKKYDFDLDKIKEHADELPVVERVKYLKQVITAYKENAGMFKEDGATETRMTTLVQKGKLIQYLEKLIEKNRKQLMKIENKFDRGYSRSYKKYRHFLKDNSYSIGQFIQKW